VTTSNEPVPPGTTYAVRRATTNDEPPQTMYLLVEYECAGTPEQECHLVSTHESWGAAVARAVALRRRNRLPFEGRYGDPSDERTARFFALMADLLPAGHLPPYAHQCLGPLLGFARTFLLAHGHFEGADRRAREALARLDELKAEAEELLRDATVYLPTKGDADD
jgi:hypothetical protein